MPDPLSTADLFARAGDYVDSRFAEGAGVEREDEAVVIRLRDNRTWRVGAVVGKLESLSEYTPTGDQEEMETVTVDVRPEDVEGLPGIPYHATVEVALYSGQPFSVATQGSSRNADWLRLSLVRKKLLEERPLRRR